MKISSHSGDVSLHKISETRSNAANGLNTKSIWFIIVVYATVIAEIIIFLFSYKWCLGSKFFNNLEFIGENFLVSFFTRVCTKVNEKSWRMVDYKIIFGWVW